MQVKFRACETVPDYVAKAAKSDMRIRLSFNGRMDKNECDGDVFFFL